MSLNIPIWFCIVKSEPVTPQGHYAYRIIQAVECKWCELDRLYAEFQSNYYNNIGCTTMIFIREPDETPMKSMSLYPMELGKMIGDMTKEVDGLKALLVTERQWKDQLAEDNRILREKLDMPDSHFKYDGFTVDLETPETRKEPYEYKDW